MPLTLGRKKKRKETELAAESTGTAAAPAPEPAPPLPAVAHFVTPASKLAAAKRGEEVKSLCGEAKITGDPQPGAAVCQKCVLAQMRVDDTKTDATSRERYQAGLTAGEQRAMPRARADAMQEIREAAERRASEAEKQKVLT